MSRVGKISSFDLSMREIVFCCVMDGELNMDKQKGLESMLNTQILAPKGVFSTIGWIVE